MKFLGFLCAVLFIATGAFAHSKVDKTSPVDGSIVEELPKTLTLSFAKKIRLTKLEMVSGEVVQPLSLDGDKSFKTDFSIPFIGENRGAYTINWRGLSEDGHAVKGSFSFEVK